MPGYKHIRKHTADYKVIHVQFKIDLSHFFAAVSPRSTVIIPSKSTWFVKYNLSHRLLYSCHIINFDIVYLISWLFANQCIKNPASSQSAIQSEETASSWSSPVQQLQLSHRLENEIHRYYTTTCFKYVFCPILFKIATLPWFEEKIIPGVSKNLEPGNNFVSTNKLPYRGRWHFTC